MSGGGEIYEYQRELTARLEQAKRERDEARAEVKQLRRELHLLDEHRTFRDALKATAERQREACAAQAERESHGMTKTAGQNHIIGNLVRATPLVTEGDK